jgi:hypothetical protein
MCFLCEAGIPLLGRRLETLRRPEADEKPSTASSCRSQARRTCASMRGRQQSPTASVAVSDVSDRGYRDHAPLSATLTRDSERPENGV